MKQLFDKQFIHPASTFWAFYAFIKELTIETIMVEKGGKHATMTVKIQYVI